MFKFIEVIMAGIATVTEEEVAEAQKSIKPVDKDSLEPIGVMPVEFQKLNAFLHRLVKQIEVEVGEIKIAVLSKIFEHDLEGVKNLLRSDKTKASIEKATTLKKFFWTALRAEFGVEDAGFIIFDADWTVWVNPVCPNCGERHGKGEHAEVFAIDLESPDELDQVLGAIANCR